MTKDFLQHLNIFLYIVKLNRRISFLFPSLIFEIEILFRLKKVSWLLIKRYEQLASDVSVNMSEGRPAKN